MLEVHFQVPFGLKFKFEAMLPVHFYFKSLLYNLLFTLVKISSQQHDSSLVHYLTTRKLMNHRLPTSPIVERLVPISYLECKLFCNRKAKKFPGSQAIHFTYGIRYFIKLIFSGIKDNFRHLFNYQSQFWVFRSYFLGNWICSRLSTVIETPISIVIREPLVT